MSPQKEAAQIANAQKSRGAATEAGRARSSQNAIRHSLCSKKYLITPEERPEFDLYYKELIEALAPEGAVEALLAEAIILDEFRLTRARLVENQIFCRGYMSTKPENQFISGAETWLAHSKELATLTLYEQRINRVLTRNKAEFESRQAARSGAGILAFAGSPPSEVPAQPPESKLETAAPEQTVGAVQSSGGFVHSSAASSADPDASFVRSSAVTSPIPDPQLPAPAAVRALPNTQSQSPEASPLNVQPPESKPETAAPKQTVGAVQSRGGFVHSNADSSADPNAGFVHSSAVTSPIPAPEPPAPVATRPEVESPEASPLFAQPRESKPEIGSPEQTAGVVHSSDGFVRSSAVAAPTPGPQPLTRAAKRPISPGAIRNAA